MPKSTRKRRMVLIMFDNEKTLLGESNMVLFRRVEVGQFFTLGVLILRGRIER